MVRKYTRKTNRGGFPIDIIQKAVNDVLSCGRKIRTVAADVGIAPTTLFRYIKRTKQHGEFDSALRLGNFRPIFTSQQETLLQQYIKSAANVYFGLSPKEVRILAYECADAFKVGMPKSWEDNKCAGPDWFSAFIKRNPSLTIRLPEATSISRASSFNRHNVKLFFSKLAFVMEREKITARDIWNVDETGLSTVQKPRKIVAPKGVKQIGSLTSGERGAHVTMCSAISATGNTVLPMFIFPRVKYHDHFVRDGPMGCIGGAQPSGWMNAENFTKFMRHFADNVKPSMDKKVLLLLDNHESHISVETLNFAKENGIIMLSFPPHCSHKLQPLDRSVFGPLKKYVSTAQDAWMRNNPGKTMTIYDLPGIAKESWPKAATPENVINGFKVSGICPFNENVFTDSDYAPGFVTDRPTPCENNADNIHVRCQNVESTLGVTVEHCSDTNPNLAPAPGINGDTDYPWLAINEYLNLAGCEVVKVDGDGHCLLHAVRKSLLYQGIGDITHEDLCKHVLEEISDNLDYYDDFSSTDAELVDDITNYVFHNQYNNDSADLVLSALCNGLGISAIVYKYGSNGIYTLAQAPGRPGVLFRGDIHLALYGEGARAHYNAVRQVQYPSEEAEIGSNNTIDTEAPVFSPESLRPHPKAAARTTKVTKRKRHTAILTDTPEKKRIESEMNARKASRPTKQTSKTSKRKTVKKQPTEKSKKAKKTKTKLTLSDEENEWYCLICLEPWTNSRSSEIWIQCHACKDWAHEQCTDVQKGRIFICQNCDSDDESDFLY